MDGLVLDWLRFLISKDDFLFKKCFDLCDVTKLQKATSTMR